MYAYIGKRVFKYLPFDDIVSRLCRLVNERFIEISPQPCTTVFCVNVRVILCA